MLIVILVFSSYLDLNPGPPTTKSFA